MTRISAPSAPRRGTTRFAGLAVVLAWLGLEAGGAALPERVGVDFFESRVRPVLVEHCYECHSATGTGKKIKGGLRLDTAAEFAKGGDSGAVVVPGRPDESLLIKAVRHADKDVAMPRGKDGPIKLPDSVIADLARWVQMGAPYPAEEAHSSTAAKTTSGHWSFQPIRNPAVPKVAEAAWPKSSIDAFILAGLESSGLHPAPAADRRTLIRRSTFDLTGLPPTPEEVEAFVADASSDAYAKVIERLLASPHYGEHWGRHWLDVVRYADTAGDTADYPVPTAWRYRNYVIDAFNQDKPYDRFLLEQIAGDILAREGPREKYAERVTATGYLAVSRRFGFDSENYQHLTIQDTIDTLGQSVLGLTLGCARCHNHKFDPVSSSEYYGLYGIFESTRYAFPGSEQKQKYRVMVPLAPVEESRPKWREFENRFAVGGRNPGAVVRSLDDIDGDFETQAVASGGSKGVLVPPWMCEGKISVTKEAQSPFKNLHPFGSVGVSLADGAGAYWIKQVFHPALGHGTAYLNLDFRVATNNPAAHGRHKFSLGSGRGAPSVEVYIGAEDLAFSKSGDGGSVRLPKPGEWNNLQLVVDIDRHLFSGTVGVPGNLAMFQARAFVADGGGELASVAIESTAGTNEPAPALEFDNVAIQETPIPPVGFTVAAEDGGLKLLTAELEKLTDTDGDFELQTDGAAPAKPWHPGPKSAVKISSASQSPFRNIYPAGKLGLHLPRTTDYNGFGQTLPKAWKAESAGKVYVGFDFRCAEGDSSGEGTWRFQVGHSYTSAAVELGLNGRQLFRQSGNSRDVIKELRPGEWYQVQLVLDLKAKTYMGVVASPGGETEFLAKFAPGWDGVVDYAFIDSGGHQPGVKPALDADNFVFRETPLPSLDSQPVESGDGMRQAQLARVTEIRRQLAEIKARADKRNHELDALLADGPMDMAYGVTEGTPHDARVQLRGDPDKLGDTVPRGFLKVLGGGTLPPDATGSGRLELARWLTRSDNPLTARVMVNRLWQYHFGQGLVKTPNDFGTRGQAPTNPELLDHLATLFIRSGWSIKAMHRLMMLSAAYQQASPWSQEARPDSTGRVEIVDAQAKPGAPVEDRFSPFARRRLEAEEIRDSILFVSGELDSAPGAGHPFPVATSWGFTQHGPFSAVYDHRKRSVYLMTQRLKRHPFLALFDGADPNSGTPDRRVSTVPTQALYFLNDPFVHEMSEKLAARLERSGQDPAARVELAYRLAFGRKPGPEERGNAIEFLSAYRVQLPEGQAARGETLALAALARVLFGSNEFLTVD